LNIREKVINLFLLRKKRIFLLLIILILLFGPASSAYASPQTIKVNYAPLHFVYDGKEYAPPEDQRPFLYKGSTFIPIRFMTNMFEKAIQWDGDTYTVTVGEPNQEELILIGEYNMNTLVRNSDIQKIDTSKLKSSSVQVSFKKVTYVFASIIKEPPIDLPGMILNSRIYVPMRFFSESLDIEIGWDPETYTISAQSEAYKEALKDLELEVGTDGPSGAPIIPAGGGAPTYDSIKSHADVQIAALRSKAESYFTNLVIQYIAADEDDKPEFIAAGKNKLAEYDSEFAGIISSLRLQLSNNGFDTSITNDYEQQYEDEKAIARSFLGL
jgi:hypothetical protein